MSAPPRAALRLLLSTLILSGATVAMASPERILVVGAPGAAQPDADVGARELMPLSAREARQIANQMRKQAALKRARQRAKEARVLMGHLRLKQATRVLKATLKSLAALQDSPESCRVARAAMQDLAFSWWQRKKLARARWWALGAGRDTLDVERLPPDYVRFARAALQSDAPARTVAMITRPAGAEVFIDCKARGKAPLSIELKRGTLVGARLSGHQPWGRAAPPSAVQVLRINLAHQEPLDLERQDPAIVDGLLRAKEAVALWVWRPSPSGRVLWRYRGGQGWRRWIAPQTPTSASAATQPAPGRRFGLGKWLLASGAVAALIAGSVFGVLARSAADDLEEAARERRLFDQELADTEDRRDAFGISAYVLWGAGAAAATALAAWLLFERPSAEESTQSLSLRLVPTPSLTLRF